ncbi:hypothetical protein CLCR_01364 [Cladophialophora carrionii]|uniref:Uncharacterized protein n=1 Tax=Cladophialophora carrionii TaxID=86049 RepID=A0A1C1CCQ3_9EURO|nr:hypothetical protein CLCR_01364 [Cladophialophora carrionii]
MEVGTIDEIRLRMQENKDNMDENHNTLLYPAVRKPLKQRQRERPLPAMSTASSPPPRDTDRHPQVQRGGLQSCVG